MLKSHMDNKETILVAQSTSASITGHPLHKGTPRESFIHEFLKDHLPTTISIGTGEIIDCNSSPGEPRNQYDIILYRNDYPKLNFGGGVNAYLIESVVATIEVKSTLTSDELERSIIAANNSKNLTTNFQQVISTNLAGSSGIKNYVVAYTGPAKMQTIHNWLKPIHDKLGISLPTLTLDETRFKIKCPSIDGVFVLKKGYFYFDNIQYGFALNEIRKAYPTLRWVMSECEDGNLLMLFHMLQEIVKSLSGTFLNAFPYINRHDYNIVTLD